MESKGRLSTNGLSDFTKDGLNCKILEYTKEIFVKISRNPFEHCKQEELA